jgi:hypothetical protein
MCQNLTKSIALQGDETKNQTHCYSLSFMCGYFTKWYNIGQLPGVLLQNEALVKVRTKYLHEQLQNRSPYRAMNGADYILHL